MTTNSNSPRRILFIASGVLAFGVIVLLWRPAKPVARLEVTKQANEGGRRVLFFQVIGAEKRFLKVDAVYKVEEGTQEERLARSTNGFFGQSRDLWPAVIDPLDDTNCENRQFGVIAPTNAAVWRLKADLFVDEPSRKYLGLLSLWKIAGKEPLFPALRMRLRSFHPRIEEIVSDPLTNSFPLEAPAVSR